jgi:hypothetical protein
MIHIKSSHRGMLHEELGIAKGKKIGISTLMNAKARAKRTGNTPLQKRATFAENTKSWNHAG